MRKRLTEWYFLTIHLSLTFLNTGTTNDTFKQYRKKDSSRHILKSSASMYESSGSKFFRTTTGMQSGPDTFDKSSLFMTCLTNLGATEILCSFELLPAGKVKQVTR